jgi:hypothetical protein
VAEDLVIKVLVGKVKVTYHFLSVSELAGPSITPTYTELALEVWVVLVA